MWANLTHKAKRAACTPRQHQPFEAIKGRSFKIIESNYLFKKSKMFKVFEIIIEIIGWLKIVASPFLLGFVIGATIYCQMDNEIGLIIGIILTLIGLIIGIIWATRIWRKEGTNYFLSRIMASPELDKKEETND